VNKIYKIYINQIFVIVLVFAFSNIIAQDVQFSQYYSNSVYLNPSFAGKNKCPYMVMNYRIQWPGLQNAFTSYAFAYDQYVKVLDGGVGVVVVKDDQGGGSISQINIDGVYSHSIQLSSRFSMQMALQASYYQWKIHTENLIFSNMIDSRTGSLLNYNEAIENQAINTLDVSAGISAIGQNIQAGIAIHHIGQPMLSKRWIPVKYTVHFGYTISLDKRDLRREKLKITPGIIFQQQQNFQQINYGVYFTKKNFTFGGWLRQSIIPNLGTDCFIAIVGISLDRFKFGYSYDVSLSKLRNSSGGSHEVSVAVQLDCFEKMKKKQMIDCPSF